jgi:DegV family protein with EDD domain
LKNFIISVDSSACFTDEELKTHQIAMVYLSYTLDGVEYEDKFANDQQKQMLYDQLEQGHMARSSKANPESCRKAWEPVLAQGNDILHLALSSKVSGSYESACLAAAELNEKYSAKVKVVDTLTGSYAVTLMAYKIMEECESATLDEAFQYAERIKQGYNLIFTVGDIKYLYRGGRISHIKALLGGLLHLKPILFVNEEGKLTFMMNARGMRQAVSLMAQKMQKNATEETQSAYIAHGGNVSLALMLKNKVLELFPKLTDIRLDYLTPVLGLHAGPGSLVLCFKGAGRNGVLDENPIKEIIDKVKHK